MYCRSWPYTMRCYTKLHKQFCLISMSIAVILYWKDLGKWQSIYSFKNEGWYCIQFF